MQKKELREYKKKAKAQLPQVEPVPLTIESVEENLSQGQGDRPEAIKARPRFSSMAFHQK